MVLSNKKLKQKLREAVTEALTSAEESKTNNPNNENPNPDSQTQKSLKALLSSATQKSRIRKKEKHKKALALKAINPQIEDIDDKYDKDGVFSEEREDLGGGSEELIEEKKRKGKKRKRESGETGESAVEVEKMTVKKNKKKKKKKKKRKKKSEKNKGSSDDVANIGSDVVANAGSEVVNLTESIKTTDGQDNEEASMKVYVGGIPYYSTEDDIRSFFESCGTITEIDCMIFPDSGKFRGIALISFKTDAAAKRALALDGSDMGGLFLKITPYKPTRAKKFTGDFAPAVVEGYNRAYVGNLSWDITEDELRKFFSGCNISSIRFGEDKETKEFRGYAHVDFADSISMNTALKLDQEIVLGRPVRVRCAVPHKKVLGNISKANETSLPQKANETSLANFDETSKVIADNESGNVSSVSETVVSGKIRRRTCYECGEKGHLSSACPKKLAADQANEGGI